MTYPEEIINLYQSIKHELKTIYEIHDITGNDIWIYNYTKGTNVVLWYHENWGASLFFYRYDIEIKIIGLTYPQTGLEHNVRLYTYVGLSNPNFDILSEIKQFLGEPNEV